MQRAMITAFLSNCHKQGYKGHFWEYMSIKDWALLMIAEAFVFGFAVADMLFLLLIGRQPIYEFLKWGHKRRQKGGE